MFGLSIPKLTINRLDTDSFEGLRSECWNTTNSFVAFNLTVYSFPQRISFTLPRRHPGSINTSTASFNSYVSTYNGCGTGLMLRELTVLFGLVSSFQLKYLQDLTIKVLPLSISLTTIAGIHITPFDFSMNCSTTKARIITQFLHMNQKSKQNWEETQRKYKRSKRVNQNLVPCSVVWPISCYFSPLKMLSELFSLELDYIWWRVIKENQMLVVIYLLDKRTSPPPVSVSSLHYRAFLKIVGGEEILRRDWPDKFPVSGFTKRGTIVCL